MHKIKTIFVLLLVSLVIMMGCSTSARDLSDEVYTLQVEISGIISNVADFSIEYSWPNVQSIDIHKLSNGYIVPVINEDGQGFQLNFSEGNRSSEPNELYEYAFTLMVSAPNTTETINAYREKIDHYESDGLIDVLSRSKHIDEIQFKFKTAHIKDVNTQKIYITTDLPNNEEAYQHINDLLAELK